MMLASKSKGRKPSHRSRPSHRLEFQPISRDRSSSNRRHRLPFKRHEKHLRDAPGAAVTEGVTRNRPLPSRQKSLEARAFFAALARRDGRDGYCPLLLGWL
jgi:hypothetical protein